MLINRNLVLFSKKEKEMSKPTVEILLKENQDLKTDLEIAEDKVKIQAAQLFKLGQAVDTLTGNKKGESDGK